MNKYPIYTDIGIEKHKIASYQMDLKGQATLPVINNLFQEIAGNHAEANGFGFTNMLKNGHIWVLTRMKTEIAKYPQWNEEIFVKTWIRNREKLFSERAFQLVNKHEEVMATALTSWMLIDLIHHKPKTLDTIKLKINIFPNDRAVQTELKKIPSVDRVKYTRSHEVLFDDIDVNQHVNNVKYIEWILASFPYEFRKSHNVSEFETNFTSELKYGHKVNIHIEQISEYNFIAGILNAHEKEVCRAEIKWIPI
jgi:medium-chain acyl-[acyl-carrier-protein] hydrolase